MLAATWGTAAGALLLLATGAVKLRRPQPTAYALTSLRVAWRVPAALALGAVEVVVGVAALVAPWASVAVAVLYLGFAGYVARGLRSGRSCGCAGVADSPVTPLHLVVNLVLAAAALSAAVAGAQPLLLLSAGALLAGLALAALGAGLGWLAVTVHPQLVAARAALRT